MKKLLALFLSMTLILTLVGCGTKAPAPVTSQSVTPEPEPVSTEQQTEPEGVMRLNAVLNSLTAGKSVAITLEQGDISRTYDTVLDEYWAIHIPLNNHSGEFSWNEISETEWKSRISAENGDGESYRLILAGSEDDGSSWSFMMQSDSQYVVLVYESKEYYFFRESDAESDHKWWGVLLRYFYDTVEFEALGGWHINYSPAVIPDDGQDYASAALAGYRQKEEAHLHVSPGSAFRYTFVKCSITPAESETEHFRKIGEIDESTWAFYARTIFVPENEAAYNQSMAGNTEEYCGDDADVPEGAWYYKRVGYVTLSDDGWHVKILGTGW
ncbi:MAG: hypothetical protein PUB32_02710 [Clostridiales bacterium]|nr:hypothetical protein [Clostridiales bacterium]